MNDDIRKVPCKPNCKNRKIKCHASCELYQKFVEYNEKRKKAQYLENELNDFFYQSAKKS